MGHGENLLRMIRCRTVSVKEQYDDGEFAKLRQVMEDLFPLIHQKAQKHTFGHDCWMYCIPGRDPARNIMLMSHHDVVEARGDWTHEAYGEIAEGKLWGRGTVDTKTPLYAEFAALEALLREGWEPACNVWLGSSHNEEISGDGIPKARDWFLERGILFETVLDEGGAVIDPPLGGMKCPKCAMIAVHEKGKIYLELKATEGNNHTSLTAAARKSPIERMNTLLCALTEGKLFVRRLNEPVVGMFSHLGPHCRFPLNLVLTHSRLFGGILRRVLPKISPQAGAMLGTTCVPREISGSYRTHECTAMVFARPVDQDDWQKDLAAIRALADSLDIAVSVRPDSEYQGPADMRLPPFAHLKECVAAVFPGVPAAPMILPAGTDARTLTDVCPCVLRFAPIRLSSQQLASVHAEDENIDLDAIDQAVAFYRYFLEHYR